MRKEAKRASTELQIWSHPEVKVHLWYTSCFDCCYVVFIFCLFVLLFKFLYIRVHSLLIVVFAFSF